MKQDLHWQVTGPLMGRKVCRVPEKSIPSLLFHADQNSDFETVAEALAAPTYDEIMNIYTHRLFRQNSFLSTFKRLAEVMERWRNQDEASVRHFAVTLFMDLLGEFEEANVYDQH
jgi:hypothetical protein